MSNALIPTNSSTVLSTLPMKHIFSKISRFNSIFFGISLHLVQTATSKSKFNDMSEKQSNSIQLRYTKWKSFIIAQHKLNSTKTVQKWNIRLHCLNRLLHAEWQVHQYKFITFINKQFIPNRVPLVTVSFKTVTNFISVGWFHIFPMIVVNTWQ